MCQQNSCKRITLQALLFCSLLITLASLSQAANTAAEKLLPTFVATLENPANYRNHIYIDKSANQTGDGSKDKPFNNLKAALRHAKPGTFYHVAAGHYDAPGVMRHFQGKADAPIAIVAEGNVVIDAKGKGSNFAFIDGRYLLIDGLTIINSGVHGMNIDDGGDYQTPGGYVVLRNLHFKNLGQGGNHDCLKLSGIDHFAIYHNEFEGCNQGEAIDMVGCHHGLIAGNYFHDMPGTAVQTKGGSADILIHSNRFERIKVHAVNLGGDTNPRYLRPLDSQYEGNNIRVAANLIIRSGKAAFAYMGCNQCYVSNNTIIEPSNYVVRFGFKPSGQIQFINNAIHFKRQQLDDRQYLYIGENMQPKDFRLESNYWHMLDIDLYKQPFYGLRQLDEVNAIRSIKPLLDKDYRPLPGSPLIGKATSIPFELRFDYNANHYQQPASIGSYSTSP